MTPQDALAALAMFILGGLSFVFAFHAVPAGNHDFIIYSLGALSGALTVGGARKIADKITTSNGPDATIQNDGDKP